MVTHVLLQQVESIHRQGDRVFARLGLGQMGDIERNRIEKPLCLLPLTEN